MGLAQELVRKRRNEVSWRLVIPARGKADASRVRFYDLGVAVDASAPVTLRQLEDHLWQAADLFRNKVSNQKDYILAVLFFKRASDLYREETEAALAELGDIDGVEELARDPAFHVLQVPDGQSWDDVRDTDEALMGKALNDALAAIGRANPKQLAGVFERTDFNNKMALPADDLRRIVDHFHALGPLTNKRVPADLLGQAYEWLIAKFAAAAGKGGGEFYTPAEVGKLCAALLEPREGDRIYDPTCGSGGLLLQCLYRAEAQGVNTRSLFLYGQELNPETWAISRMNMLLHGAGDAAEIKLGDTLAAPAFLEKGALRTFDRVVANPPFSSKNWGHERFKNSGDPYGRIKHLPPKKYGETAFLQHMLASVGEDGMLAVVLPNGCFFRSGAELALRNELVDDDLIEAIVQLPADLFYGTAIPACVLVCSRNKAADRRGRVLMIDLSSGFDRRDTKNVLRADAIEQATSIFRSGAEETGVSEWATQEQIAKRGYGLVVPRYVGTVKNGAGPEAVDVASAITQYQTAKAEQALHESQVDGLLAELASNGSSQGDWPMVELADIATLDCDRVPVESGGTYRIAGVLNAGKGLFWRETIDGSDTTYPVLHRLRVNQLVMRKLTAWEGPITVVTPEFDGGFVSTEFPTFTLDESRLLPDFMALVCQRPMFWEEMRVRTRGTAKRRGRVNPADLLSISIPLPPLEVQQKLAEIGRAVAGLRRQLAAFEVVAAAAREHILADQG